MSEENLKVISRDLTPEEAELLLKDCSALAVDTETKGLNPLRDKLCTVQLYNENKVGFLVKIDVEKDYPVLTSVLTNPNVTNIMHFANFDLKTLGYHLDVSTASMGPVYCTRLASKVARTYAPKHSLKDVVFELTGEVLNKTVRVSNWSGDLTDKQIEYAFDDVRYLHELKDKMNSMVEQDNRLDLLHEAMIPIPIIANLELLGWDVSLYGYSK
jgi:ribonuclease D